ncbi:MAG: hypothetical protein JNM69_23080 [Archangium sp.]|nr:hypothetical protein [Archangium sp.]
MGLLIVSLPILAVGLVLAPWADRFFDSTRRVFASDNERAAGDFMWQVSSALLFLGVGGIGWAIPDLIVGPTKR